MKVRKEKHYDQLRDVIGQIGLVETLEALSEISQGFADIRVEHRLPSGSSAIAAAGLSVLAEKVAFETNFEIHGRRGKQ